MNEKKDKWEQLTEIPQDYEVNPDLIKKAESAMRQERRTHRRNVHVWQTVAGSLAACCLLLIMIPAFRSLGNGPITPPDSSSSSTEERYFDDGSIIKENADIIEVVEANHLQIKYYNDETVTSSNLENKGYRRIGNYLSEYVLLRYLGYSQFNGIVETKRTDLKHLILTKHCQRLCRYRISLFNTLFNKKKKG